MQPDIIDSAGFGYVTVWRERGWLLRLALVPALIRVACLGAILAAEVNPADFLRQTLFLLPAYFAEGWAVAQFLRLLLTGERWPIPRSGNMTEDFRQFAGRVRGIKSAILIYVLVKMAVGALLTLAMILEASAPSPEEAAAGQGGSAAGFFAAIALLVAALWSFRFAWLYIPAAVNMPLSLSIQRMGGLMASLPMLGCWMISTFPVVMLNMLMVSTLLEPYDGKQDQAPFGLSLLASTIPGLSELLIALISTAAMTSLLRPIFTQPENRKPHP